MIDEARLIEMERRNKDAELFHPAAGTITELIAEVRRLRAALVSAREDLGGTTCDYLPGHRCSETQDPEHEVCTQCKIGRALKGEAPSP